MAMIHNDEQKKISVGDISSADRARIQDVLNVLMTLKSEVDAKVIGSLEKKDFIKSRVARLKELDSVNIDEEEFSKTEKSVIEFVLLLEKMIAEINAEILFYNGLISDNPPAHVLVHKDESDDFNVHLEHRIASIKKYVKNAKRDLAVSYSRYCFAFEAQIRQITYVEYVLKHAPKDSGNTNLEKA